MEGVIVGEADGLLLNEGFVEGSVLGFVESVGESLG